MPKRIAHFKTPAVDVAKPNDVTKRIVTKPDDVTKPADDVTKSPNDSNAKGREADETTLSSESRHTTTTSGSSSLLQLPPVLWRRACRFLDLEDMEELCRIDVSFDHACRHALLPRELTLTLRPWLFNKLPCDQLPKWRTVRSLGTFGQYVQRIRFVAQNFRVHNDVIQELVPLLQDSLPLLRSVRVSVLKDKSPAFLFCPDQHASTWTTALAMIARAGDEREVGVSLTINMPTDADTGFTMWDSFLRMNQNVDISCDPKRFVTKIRFDHEKPCQPLQRHQQQQRQKQKEKEWGECVSPTLVRSARLMGLFTAVKELVVPIDYVTDRFVNDLGLVACSALTQLKVEHWSDLSMYSKEESVSKHTWDKLLILQPKLTVSLKVKFYKRKEGTSVLPYLLSFMRPNVPLTSLKIETDMKQGLALWVANWYKALLTKPDLVSAGLRTSDPVGPNRFVSRMRAWASENGFRNAQYHRERDGKAFYLHYMTMSR